MKFLFFAVLICLNLGQAGAAGRCASYFTEAPAAVKALVLEDPVLQNRQWEQTANYPTMRRSAEPLQIFFSKVDEKDVRVTTFPNTPDAVKKLIYSLGGGIRWFHHPYNTYRFLPFFNSARTGGPLAYRSASRSLFIESEGDLFSIKMPSNFVIEPTAEDRLSVAGSKHWTPKTTTKEDIIDGKHRMNYIHRIESEFGSDPDLLLTKEVATVADRATGEGYLLRDLNFLKDGNYYLPAFSIPFVGAKIAALHGASFEDFWGEHYASALGRAKAQLLMRYGLQMETPNAQNILIQLDGHLRPTGKLVFRDLSDTVFFIPAAQALGETAELDRDASAEVENTNWLAPFFSNSVRLFDEAGEPEPVPSRILAAWGVLHNQSYRQQIEKILQQDLGAYLVSLDGKPSSEKRWIRLFESAETRGALQRYRARLREEHRTALP